MSQAISVTQSQTAGAFGFQWAMRDAYDTPSMRTMMRNWLVERYCVGDHTVVDGWLAGGPKTIVDAGCGAGLSALELFGHRLKGHHYTGVDLALDAMETARTRFAEQDIPAAFRHASISDVELPAASVDLIFSEGVMHHTDDTRKTMLHLARSLKPGGRFAFYVYARKAAIREFTDDYVRQQLVNLSEQEAWDALRPLTALGKALGELDIEIDVPEDIPFLGIKKGRQNLQRFIYWNVMKMYYRPEFSLEEMNHINFDWFRPLNCHRHTPDEVKGWCHEAGLSIEHMDVQEAGITVVAIR